MQIKQFGTIYLSVCLSIYLFIYLFFDLTQSAQGAWDKRTQGSHNVLEPDTQPQQNWKPTP